jgi:diguanylate cyclase (GGDEF)-like protein
LNKSLEERLKHCKTLPTLPGVALRIIELSRDHEVDLGRLTSLIGQDPALAGKILRVTNSPLYAHRRKCNNLRQAIALLGLRATQSLALSFALQRSLDGSGRVGMDYNLYWNRSVLSAFCGRALALSRGSASAEELFLAALLQDIGMLALAKAMPELYATITVSQNDHEQLLAAERHHLGTDHAEISAWLLKSWNLPGQYTQAAAGSHDPSQLVTTAQEREFVHTVFCAGQLADVWLNADREQALIRAKLATRDLLGIDEDSLLAIIDGIGIELPEMEALFEVELVDDRQAADIMEEGRELLLIHNMKALQNAVDTQQDVATLQSQTRALEEENRRDSLTGLYNRAYLNEVLANEFTQAISQNWPLSVAFIDLDHFKTVNDTHGHQIGDSVLQHVTRVMSGIARGADVIARYGGEEFVLVLAGCETASAARVCERIVQAVAGKPYNPGNGQMINVTVSIGIATHNETSRFEKVEDLLRSADRALYTAKIQGRNRVVIYDTSRGS